MMILQLLVQVTKVRYSSSMRILGIDYGSKRVGLALSNPEQTFAQPYTVIANRGDLVTNVRKIITKEGIVGIVIGESKNFKGEDNVIMKDIKIFIESLKKEVALPIFLEPEFLSSHQAQHFQGKHDLLDASAAAIILQSYLDRKKHTHK